MKCLASSLFLSSLSLEYVNFSTKTGNKIEVKVSKEKENSGD